MGATGGYYSGKQFFKATNEELAQRGEARKSRGEARQIGSSLREDYRKEIHDLGWSNKWMSTWSGTTRNPSLWKGGELSDNQKELVDKAKSVLGMKGKMTDKKNFKLGRFLDLVKSQSIQASWYDYAYKHGIVGKGYVGQKSAKPTSAPVSGGKPTVVFNTGSDSRVVIKPGASSTSTQKKVKGKWVDG